MRRCTPVQVSIMSTLLALVIGVAWANVTIRFQHQESRFVEPLNAIIAEFNQANPDITVVPELVPWVDAFSLLLNQHQTENLPDVFVVGNTWVSPFAQMGMMLDITERLEGWVTEAGPILEDVFDGDRLFYELDGSWYGMPWMAETRMLFYRSDWLEELGLDVPTTHDEFLAAAIAMTDARAGRWGYGLLGSPDGVTFQTIATWFIQRGAYLFREGADGRIESNFDSAEMAEAIGWYTDLLLEHAVAPPGAANHSLADAESAFQGGSIGMVKSGPFFFTALSENPMLEGRWGVTLLPMGPANDSMFLGGYPLCISAQSNHPDEAWRFVKYMTSRDAHLAYALASLIPPARKSLANEFAGDSPLLRTQVEGLARAVPNSFPFESPPILASMTDGEMPLQRAVQSVLLRRTTPEQAALETHQRVTEMFERWYGRE